MTRQIRLKSSFGRRLHGASLVSVAKRIKAVQMAYFLRFVHAILLDMYVCLLSHVWYEAD